MDLLVDSGANFSIIPRTVLSDMGISRHSTQSFEVADGRIIHRDVGIAAFFYKGNRADSSVIFGEEQDASLVGVLTLEALALTIDPSSTELKPVRLRM